MQTVITITAHTAIIVVLAMQTDARGQGVDGSNIGQPYFKINQSASLGRTSSELEFEPVFAYEIQAPCSVFELGCDSDLSLEIHDGIELQRSRNALKTFALSTKTFQLPFSFDLMHSDLLLARWDSEFTKFGTSVLVSKPKLNLIERSPHGHFELVWASTGFQLNCYEDRDTRTRKCTPLPAILTEQIPLTVALRGSNLVLIPKIQRGPLPFFVILSNRGTAFTTMNPFDCIVPLLFQDQDNVSAPKAFK